MQAKRIFEACVCTSDLAEAERFYTRVLGLEVAKNFAPRGISFRCGLGVVIVFDPAHCEKMENGIPGHGTKGAGHVAFAAEADELPAWRAHLAACGVPIESEVEWESGGRSIYFRDPAGNSLELAPPTLWGLGSAEPVSEAYRAQADSAMRAGWKDPEMDDYNDYDAHRKP